MAEQVTRSLNMSGVFWRPEDSGNTKMGTLQWIPYRGCILTLVDESDDFSWGKSPGIILGLNSERDPITLVECKYYGGKSLKITGNAFSVGHELAARCALVGRWFEKETEIVLSELYVEYAGIDNYVTATYYDFDTSHDAEGRLKFDRAIFSIPKFDASIINDVEIRLHVSLSFDKGIEPQHKLHVMFPESRAYKSEGGNYNLVHDVLPSILSALLGHESFVISLIGQMMEASVEIFDSSHGNMSWEGDSRFRDRLVNGGENTLRLWPKILSAWAENHSAVAQLCNAYIKLLTDGRDGFFDVNNLVHVFFGLEAYHKSKCNLNKGALGKALKYAIGQIKSYFQDVEKFSMIAKEIDTSALSHARQVLVHSNEGEPNYPLVFQQLMFITRSVLLMEMEYPVSQVRQDTQHWDLWHFFAERRKSTA